MSKVHIRAGNSHGEYTVVIHFDVQSGVNLAGVPWSDAIVRDGANVTILKKIDTTQKEFDAIYAGTRYEFLDLIRVKETMDDAHIIEIIDRAIEKKQSELQFKYKYYGKTIY